jgi:mannose-6-phosphate isomerase-like protein (cupin superfamily)
MEIDALRPSHGLIFDSVQPRGRRWLDDRHGGSGLKAGKLEIRLPRDRRAGHGRSAQRRPDRQWRDFMFKIMPLNECPVHQMENGRGEVVRIVNPTSVGTEKVDLHLNRLVAGGPRGKVHRHTKSDNIYIVRVGEGTLTVEGESYTIRTNDVVYIPAGMKHSLSNLSSADFEIFEIYAPSGSHFDVENDD